MAPLFGPRIGPGIEQFGVSAFMPRRVQDLVVFAAPGFFVVLWATGFIGAKRGLPYAEPLTFLALRMGTVVVLLGAILSLTRPKWPRARGLAHSAVTGVMVHGLGLGGVFVAIQNGLSAGMVALVMSLQPALTSTIANRWLGERVRLIQWVGLALGLFGIYLVVRDRATVGGAMPLAWLANAVGLLGITVGTLYQKRFGGGIDWRPALCVQYAAAGLLFAFGAAAFETRVVDWTPQFVFALGWLVLVLSVGAVWLLYFLLRRAAATRVASLFYLTPPVTALMAWALFDERLAPLALLGMAVCVLGVFLVNWKSKRFDRRQPPPSQ
jgi:drug/metabolite transporter (DMT)-like permease